VANSRWEERAGALFVGNSAFFNSRRERVAALAIRHALPASSDRDIEAAFATFALRGGCSLGRERRRGISDDQGHLLAKRISD
jgi:hypothetical protein